MQDLIPVDDTDFFTEPEPPRPPVYKIYHDGGSYIGTVVRKCGSKRREYAPRHDEWYDLLLSDVYYNAVQNGYNYRKRRHELIQHIRSEMSRLFPELESRRDIDEWIDKKVRRILHNIHCRKKRFKRKAHLNKWNYFVTITFSDKKMTPAEFEKALRKCLSNFHTRHGWLYMGVFEHAPETGRLHFHGLLYIPSGQMVGEIYEKTDYSTAQQRMQTTHPNTFFEKAFGRNDFAAISEKALNYGNTIDYILKYIGKTNSRIVYSRGIKTEFYMRVENNDIFTTMFDYVTKYILFDDVIDWARDVMRFKYKQMSITDILCNPPRAA